jgi:hypothetical protein
MTLSRPTRFTALASIDDGVTVLPRMSTNVTTSVLDNASAPSTGFTRLTCTGVALYACTTSSATNTSANTSMREECRSCSRLSATASNRAPTSLGLFVDSLLNGASTAASTAWSSSPDGTNDNAAVNTSPSAASAFSSAYAASARNAALAPTNDVSFDARVVRNLPSDVMKLFNLEIMSPPLGFNPAALISKAAPATSSSTSDLSASWAAALASADGSNPHWHAFPAATP